MLGSKLTSKEGAGAVSSADELDRLYRLYRETIRRHMMRHFGSGPPDPEDAVQAAFEKFAALKDRSQIANPGAFLMTSARNYVLDQRRRLKVRSDHSDGEQKLGDWIDDFDAERVLSGKERWEILERAIRAMEPRRQEILIMHRMHGLTCAEIARRKNCSATLVKLLLAEALLLCTRVMREAGDE